MHPLLGRPGRLAAYLALAAAFGGMLALLMEAIAPGDFASALAFALPMTLVYAFQCLSVWYRVRSLAGADRRAAANAAVGGTLAGLASALVWCGLGWLWARALVALG